MPDCQVTAADAALAIMAFAATFYLFKALNLFFKDVMRRVLRLTAAALFVIVLFSQVDFVLNIVGINLEFPLSCGLSGESQGHPGRFNRLVSSTNRPSRKVERWILVRLAFPRVTHCCVHCGHAPYIREDWSHSVASILFIASDAVLAIMSTVGAYYSVKARGLFFKDIMGRVFGLLVVWFGLLALVTVVDIFSLGFISTVIPLVQIGEIIATAPLVIAVIMLIRWANSSPKSRTEP